MGLPAAASLQSHEKRLMPCYPEVCSQYGGLEQDYVCEIHRQRYEPVSVIGAHNND